MWLNRGITKNSFDNNVRRKTGQGGGPEATGNINSYYILKGNNIYINCLGEFGVWTV